MSQLTYWHVRWVIPAAVVEAARRLGGGDVERGLRLIVERGELWMRNIALELLADRGELQAIQRDLQAGLRPDPRLVEKILASVSHGGNGSRP